MGRLAGVVVLALAASIALFPTQVQHAADNPSTIAINGRFWDGNGAVVVEDGAVLIQDGRIAASGVAGAPQEPPAAPSELTADPILPGWFAAVLRWRDNADERDGYRIERSETGEDGPWVLLRATIEACPSPQDDLSCGYMGRNLVPETAYWFRVAAVNRAGVSAYSNIAKTVTQPRPVAEPGTITGVLFHDRNGDGDRDTGENLVPGTRQVTLMRDGDVIETRVVGDGNYLFHGLAPGNYTVASDLDDYWLRGCSGVEFSYNPLQRPSCDQPVLPWNPTSPNPVSVSYDGGGAVVDFGAEPADVMVVRGDALLETGHAPMGTVIIALVKGNECGTTTVVGGMYDDFSINILGAGEREGCALPGDQVQFTVGDVLAGNTMRWKPLFDPSRFPFLKVELIVPHFGDIIAMQDHVWYWFERSGDNPVPDGTLVQAMIDGVVCGETRVESLPSESIAGFSQLLVSSSDVEEGCGREGSTVSFQVNGLRATTQVLWELGLRRLHLVVHGDPDCDFDVDALDALFVLWGVAGLVGWLSCGDPDALPDGTMNSLDALLILQLEAGLIEQLPITSLPWPRPVFAHTLER